jgi:hypothetical protein
VDLADQLESVDPRHLDVDQHKLDRLARDLLEGLGRVSRAMNVVPHTGQDALESAPKVLLVVNDENVRLAQDSLRSIAMERTEGRPGCGGGAPW